MTMPIAWRVLSGLLPVLMVSGTGLAAAQPVDGGRLVACGRIADDAERLACFDRLVAGLSPDMAAERAARDAAAAEERRARAGDAFGRETMRTVVRPAAAPDDQRELVATIEEVLTGERGQMVFVLDNGQIWRQTDSQSMPPVRPGAEVTIRRQLAGRFALTVTRPRRTVTVARMR